jgi:hypothetical protein
MASVAISQLQAKQCFQLLTVYCLQNNLQVDQLLDIVGEKVNASRLEAKTQVPASSDKQVLNNSKMAVDDFYNAVIEVCEQYPHFRNPSGTKPTGKEWASLIKSIETDNFVEFERIFHGKFSLDNKTFNGHPIWRVIWFHNAKKIAKSLCLTL